MSEVYGCQDSSLSDHLKCYIKQGLVTVIGKLPEGFSKSLQHNWNSPFEEDSPGAVFQKVGGLAQIATGKSLKGFLNSFLVWEGSEPMQINIPLFFEAESNPDSEVRQAVRHIERMSSPTFGEEARKFLENPSAKGAIDAFSSSFKKLKDGEVGSRIPQPIFIKIGRSCILQKCVIENIETEDPMIYSSEGFPLQLTSTLTVKTQATLDTTDIMSTYQ